MYFRFTGLNSNQITECNWAMVGYNGKTIYILFSIKHCHTGVYLATVFLILHCEVSCQWIGLPYSVRKCAPKNQYKCFYLKCGQTQIRWRLQLNKQNDNVIHKGTITHNTDIKQYILRHFTHLLCFMTILKFMLRLNSVSFQFWIVCGFFLVYLHFE